MTNSPITSASRRLYWSLKREFWENRSLYLAPLGVAAVYLIGFLLSAGHLPDQMRAAAALAPMKQRAALAFSYDAAAGLLMLTGMVVAAIYCLDTLYGERRDRSILFWKSLPVSDRTTVLAKAIVALVLVPLIATAAILATHLVMILISSAILAASGQSVALLWQVMELPRASLLLVYHMMTVHVLWQAPVFGWLLMVSAWARRTPFLWAFLPPVAIAFVEKIVFNTTHFIGLTLYRLGGGMEALVVSGTFPTAPMTHLTPMRFVSSPGLWAGLLATAVFLAIAVALRRRREPG